MLTIEALLDYMLLFACNRQVYVAVISGNRHTMPLTLVKTCVLFIADILDRERKCDELIWFTVRR